MANRIVRNQSLRIASAVALVAAVMTSPIPASRLGLGACALGSRLRQFVAPARLTPPSARAAAPGAVFVKAVLRQNEEAPRGTMHPSHGPADTAFAAFPDPARDTPPLGLDRATRPLRC